MSAFAPLVGVKRTSARDCKVADVPAMMKANQHFGKIVLVM